MMNFIKMHGAGNDFVILDHRNEAKTLPEAEIQRICDRHFGVGCDQLVVLEPSQKADIRARFYNPDGSESGACGNATRCAADIVMKERGDIRCRVETGGGVLKASLAGENLVTVDMGPPRDIRDTAIKIEPSPDLAYARSPSPVGRGRAPSCEVENAAGWEGEGVIVNMGNPHCVFFLEDIEQYPVGLVGPKIENDALFPARTNVEFVQLLEDGRLRQRTWERGAGETLACGSGACAVAVAAIRRGLIEGREVEIVLNGGILKIEWRMSDGHVLMTGPVAYVFEGEI